MPVDGYVELYRWNDGVYEDVASMQLLNDFGIPYYQFFDLEPGSYFAKAFPVDSNLVPTYYEAALIWEEATEITLEEGNFFQADIFLISNESTDGSGIISGTVTDGAGLWTGNEEESRDDDPLEGINVLLLTDSNLPIRNLVSDVEGRFSFENLAYGRYKVMIEEAGKSHSERFVTLSPNTPSVEIGFELDDTEDFVSAVAEYENLKSVFIIQNPVAESLRIQVELNENSDLNFEIIDITAKRHQQSKMNLPRGASTLEFQVGDLYPGVYLVKISDGKASQTLSMIKQ